MKEVSIETIKRLIEEGKLECITDLKKGYVEIRNTSSGKRQTIRVI